MVFLRKKKTITFGVVIRGYPFPKTVKKPVKITKNLRPDDDFSMTKENTTMKPESKGNWDLPPPPFRQN